MAGFLVVCITQWQFLSLDAKQRDSITVKIAREKNNYDACQFIRKKNQKTVHPILIANNRNATDVRTIYSSSSAKRRICASSSTGTILYPLRVRKDSVALRAHSATASNATAATPRTNHGTLASVSTKPASDAPKRGRSPPGRRIVPVASPERL